MDIGMRDWHANHDTNCTQAVTFFVIKLKFRMSSGPRSY